MAYALNIHSDDESSVKLEQLWEECSALETSPSMTGLEYRPHITFAIYDTTAVDLLHDSFESLFGNVSRTAIRFDSLRLFESADSLVLWADPILPKEIMAIHQRIHEMFDVDSCRENYQPKNWVPHCSVATSIAIDRKEDALKFVNRKLDPFDVIFDVADLVSFLPVQVVHEMHLLKHA